MKVKKPKTKPTHISFLLVFLFEILQREGVGSRERKEGAGLPRSPFGGLPPSTVGSLLKSRDLFKRLKLYTTGKTHKPLISYWYKIKFIKLQNIVLPPKNYGRKGCRSRKSCKQPNIKAWKVIHLRSISLPVRVFLTSETSGCRRTRVLPASGLASRQP